jgi:hypothetical protein
MRNGRRRSAAKPSKDEALRSRPTCEASGAVAGDRLMWFTRCYSHGALVAKVLSVAEAGRSARADAVGNACKVRSVLKHLSSATNHALHSGSSAIRPDSVM